MSRRIGVGVLDWRKYWFWFWLCRVWSGEDKPAAAGRNNSELGRVVIVPLGEDESGLFSEMVRVWMIGLSAILVSGCWSSFRFVGGTVSTSLGLATYQTINMFTCCSQRIWYLGIFMLLALLSARIHCINPKFWEVYGFVVANSLFIGFKPCSRPCCGEDAMWLFGAQKGAETKRRFGLIQAKETDNERIRTAAAEAIRFRGVPVNHSGTLPF